MRIKAKKAKNARPKAKLGLPDLDQAKAAVLASLSSPESQHGINMRWTNPSGGTARNLAYRSTRL